MRKSYQLRSGTKQAYLQAEADFSKFERTVNVLLSQLSVIDDVQFQLHTEKKQLDPLSKTKKFDKIQVKIRNNGCQSRPDAELVQINQTKIQSKTKFATHQEIHKKLKIVVDAKFYTSQLSQSTIEKTLDDMSLRCDTCFEALSLLICSSSTKLTEYNTMRAMHGLSGHTNLSKLSLIILKKQEDKAFSEKVFLKDQTLYCNDLIMEYLSKDNLKIIQKELESMVQKYRQECVQAYQKKLGVRDDTRLSERTTQIDTMPDTSDNERGRTDQRSSKQKRGKSYVRMVRPHDDLFVTSEVHDIQQEREQFNLNELQRYSPTKNEEQKGSKKLLKKEQVMSPIVLDPLDPLGDKQDHLKIDSKSSNGIPDIFQENIISGSSSDGDDEYSIGPENSSEIQDDSDYDGPQDLKEENDLIQEIQEKMILSDKDKEEANSWVSDISEGSESDGLPMPQPESEQIQPRKPAAESQEDKDFVIVESQPDPINIPNGFENWILERKANHIGDLIFKSADDSDRQFDICEAYKIKITKKGQINRQSNLGKKIQLRLDFLLNEGIDNFEVISDEKGPKEIHSNLNPENPPKSQIPVNWSSLDSILSYHKSDLSVDQSLLLRNLFSISPNPLVLIKDQSRPNIRVKVQNQIFGHIYGKNRKI